MMPKTRATIVSVLFAYFGSSNKTLRLTIPKNNDNPPKNPEIA